MKLQSRKKKIIPIVIIAVVAVVLIAAIVAVVMMLNPNGIKGAKEIQEIAISISPETKYAVGEKFDPTGLKIQVITGDPKNSYFVNYPHPDLQISGFDSSKPGEVIVRVSYKGHSTGFKVTIKEYTTNTDPTLTSIRLSKDLSFPLEFWNDFGPEFSGVNLIATYSDGTEEEVPLRYEWCSGFDLNLDSTGTTQFNVSYTNDRGETAQTVVTVTITN